MSYLLASLAWCLLLSHRNTDVFSSWPIDLWSPQYLPDSLNYLSVSLLWSLQASFTQTHTHRAEDIHTEKCLVNFTATCWDATGPFYSPFSLFSHACSLQIHYFSAHASSQINKLPWITFTAFIPVLLHPHPNLLFLRDWRHEYRFVYVSVLWW